MLSRSWHPVRIATAAVLTAAFFTPNAVLAQTAGHLVSPSDLQKATQDATHARQQNLDTLRGFLSSERAQKALESAHMNPQQVQNAVAGLNDHELAQLAQRATRAQNDFAAGNMSDHDLLIILIAIAALVLIIVAVR